MKPSRLLVALAVLGAVPAACASGEDEVGTTPTGGAAGSDVDAAVGGSGGSVDGSGGGSVAGGRGGTGGSSGSGGSGGGLGGTGGQTGGTAGATGGTGPEVGGSAGSTAGSAGVAAGAGGEVGGTAGSAGAAGAALVLYTQFETVAGWGQRIGSSGGTISAVSDAQAEDGSALELLFPGIPALWPDENTGPGYAVEVFTSSTVHYGRFELGVRFASCATDEEVVNGIFTYFNDGGDHNGNGIVDNAEIDFEVLCGEPHLLWMTVWTDYQSAPTEQFRKTTRVIDMRDGTYWQTPDGQEGVWGVVEQAEPLPGINEADFGNPDRFYVLGFEWQPTYVRYFIQLGSGEVELWRLDKAESIPQLAGNFFLNVWHTGTHWMGGGEADYPESDARMHVDWVRIWQ